MSNNSDKPAAAPTAAPTAAPAPSGDYVYEEIKKRNPHLPDIAHSAVACGDIGWLRHYGYDR